jgi:hypothetical protein
VRGNSGGMAVEVEEVRYVDFVLGGEGHRLLRYPWSCSPSPFPTLPFKVRMLLLAFLWRAGPSARSSLKLGGGDAVYGRGLCGVQQKKQEQQPLPSRREASPLRGEIVRISTRNPIFW